MGCGSATPQKVINNDQLGQRVDTNDEWIKTRTGIRERRVIGEHESLIDIATKATLNAIKMANWDEKTIDLIILATSTPEDLFGSAPKNSIKYGSFQCSRF